MEVDDEIHGKIELTPVCAAFARHPHFERLRRVRQMGSGWLVFPGATHTRHQHSLGVCWLARRMLDALGVAAPLVREAVMVAALYHDVGHAPFSHTFDRFGDVRFEHEARSQHLLAAAFADLRSHPALAEAGFDEETARWAARLIDPGGEPRSGRRYLEQVVSNENILDVDKLDYLMRDCVRLTGQPLDIDVYGLIDRVTVCGDSIAFDERDRDAVRRLLDCRTRFHRRFYCHPAVEASGWMLAQLTHTHLKNLCVSYDDLDIFCGAVVEMDDRLLQNMVENRNHCLHGMAKRIVKKKWIKHVRDTYDKPAGLDDNHVVFTWDVEVSRHTSHNAMQRIPFHRNGEALPPPPPPPPRGDLIYRVFRY